MLAVIGTALTFAGLVVFFVFLNLHRRSGVDGFLNHYGLGLALIAVCMTTSLYGITMVGQYAVNPGLAFDGAIAAEMAGIAVISLALVRLLYLPPPVAELPFAAPAALAAIVLPATPAGTAAT